jgi:hypothetical protein
MQKFLVFLTLAVSAVFAWPGGSQFCETSQPQHTDENGDLIAPQESAAPFSASAKKSGNNYNVEVSVRGGEELEGILVRPLSLGGYTASGYNNDLFHTLEDDKCVTHQSKDKKNGKYQFLFKGDGSDASFLVVGLKEYNEFWTVRV